MDGIHDLGGKAGHSVVDVHDPVQGFHERWHARVFAVMTAATRAGVVRNTDQFRHAVERIDPAAYLTHGYYGRWLGGLENLWVESGLITRRDIDERALALGQSPHAQIASRPAATQPAVTRSKDRGDDTTPRSVTAARPVTTPERFAVGQTVVTSRHPTIRHTRLPAYARGRRGVVVAHHGAWVLPDTNAHGQGECPEHLYTVAFSAEELWGDEREVPHADTSVRLDLFESYLSELTANRGDTSRTSATIEGKS